MTTLQIVAQAHENTGSWDMETVLTETLRMGYDIKVANDVKRALETLKTGVKHESNGNLYTAREHISTMAPDYQKRRREERRRRGICMNCGKRKPKQGCVTCQECITKMAGYGKRRKYKSGGPAVREMLGANRF